MNTKKLSFAELKALVAAYVDNSKIGAAWTSSSDNVAGLLDKIAKTFTIDGNFNDKLAFMDGEELPLGKTLEEWYQDLILPVAYDDFTSDNDNYKKTLAPYDPTYRPASYSYDLGRKVLPITERYDNLQRAANTQGEYVALTNMILKRLDDSFAMFKYGVKKEIIAAAIDRIANRRTSAGTFSASTQYTVGTCLQSAASSGTYGVVVKAIPASSSQDWAARVADGSIIVLSDYKQLAKPTDTATGEAFIKQIKDDVETLSFANEGNSWNGNTLGSSESGLVLVIPKGLKSSLDVDTLAGAFNEARLAFPCQIVVVDEIPSQYGYAVLMDERSMRLHPTYRAVREQQNALGDYISYFLHTGNTAFISNNTAIIAYHE